MNCICCDKHICNIYAKWPQAIPERDAWKDAGVHEFIPGDGSRYDTIRFVVAICDDCIEAKLVVVKEKK